MLTDGDDLVGKLATVGQLIDLLQAMKLSVVNSLETER